MDNNYPSKKLISLLLQLYGHISVRRRYQLLGLLGLTLLSSFVEIISLGAVIPFIGILSQPEIVFEQQYLSGFINWLGVEEAADLVLPLTVVFAVAAIVAGGLRMLLLWVGVRLGNVTGADLGIEVFRRTLYQPYSVHVSRNSSEIISAITQKVGTASAVLISTVTVFISLMLFTSILLVLVAMDPMASIIATITFAFAYGIIAWQTRRRLMNNSEKIANQQTGVVKTLQEGLGAIRDVLLDGTQDAYSGIYRTAVMQLQRAGAENTFINQAPRFAMEAIGISMIAVFALLLSYRLGGFSAALPILAALALGAQRLLPLMQQLYGNWSVLAGSKAALVDVLELLDQPLPAEVDNSEISPLTLENTISFENVSFQYGKDSPWVLNGINLKIKKGTRVGFIGSTGCGKSTLLDLLMSLLDPTEGDIRVDGESIVGIHKRTWQQSIAHVPQFIYLADNTIASNIAFGVPIDKIDFERVRIAASQAKLSEFIESRPEGYNAIIGERGIRISGGQRQRIGIARALYKKATVLVFDEATSALDSKTEKEIMETIEGLNNELTILIVAHRLTTLKNCTQIVEIEGGNIKKIGDYKEIVKFDMASTGSISELS
jgi:ATP-binding cassette, subfamily B, bacterial PglK